MLLGYEQMNKYSVLDQDGNTVALMAEDAGGLGTAVGRQVLRRHRSFTATVFSADGAAHSSGMRCGGLVYVHNSSDRF